MTLTLGEARDALRGSLADTATPASWSDADLDGALLAALAQLDALAPWPGLLTLAAGGTDRLPLPGEVRRVLAVLHEGVPLSGWGVWAGQLLFGEPLSGTVEVRCWLVRALPSASGDPLPVAGPAEEAFVLAAATEALLERALARQARWQGPPGPLAAALAAAREARVRAAAALPRVLRTLVASVR